MFFACALRFALHFQFENCISPIYKRITCNLFKKVKHGLELIFIFEYFHSTQDSSLYTLTCEPTRKCVISQLFSICLCARTHFPLHYFAAAGEKLR